MEKPVIQQFIQFLLAVVVFLDTSDYYFFFFCLSIKYREEVELDQITSLSACWSPILLSFGTLQTLESPFSKARSDLLGLKYLRFHSARRVSSPPTL